MTLIESLNRTLLSLLAFFTLVLGGVYFLANSIDPKIVKEVTVKEIQGIIGHPFEVKGGFNVKLWPIPTIKMNDVQLLLDNHPSMDTLIKAKTLILKLDIWPLLKTWNGPESKKDIDIDSFVMEKVQIHAKKLSRDYLFEQVSGYVKANKIPNLDFKIQNNKSNLKGHFNFESNRVVGDLNSTYFDVKDLPISIEDLAIFFSGSDSLMTKLNIKVDALKTKTVLFNQTSLTAKIDKGKIILSPLHATMAEGLVQGSIILEKNKTQLHLQAKNIILEKLMTQAFGYKNLLGGKTDITLFATGQGNTFESVLESLTGRALFVMKNATLKDVQIKTSVSQLFFRIFHAVNPLVNKQRHTEIQCAILRLNLQNGIAYANNNFGLETPEFNIWGTGHFSLKTQEIEAELVNKPKGGLSIEIGQFAKYVTVRGTLSDPKLSFNAKGLIQEGISLITGIVTGGVSTIAEQLFKISENNTSACESIINKKNE